MAEKPPIHLTHELQTKNGSSLEFSQHGSQALGLKLNRTTVLHSLSRFHAIGAPRLTEEDNELSPEELEAKRIIGETAGDGGSWWSFDDNHKHGKLKPLPMHSPASAPFTTYALEAKTPSSISMRAGGAENKTFQAYFGDDKYTVTRTFALAQVSGRDVATISTTIKNVGGHAATTPSAVEHSYFETDPECSFLLADGSPVPINEFLKPKGHGTKNDMDQTPNPSGICYREGMVAFVNADGNVIVARVNLKLKTLQGEINIPVRNWGLYRQHTNDSYTAIEPKVEQTLLQSGESYTLNVVMTTYDSVEEFQRALQ